LLYTEIKINNKLFLGETMKKFLLTTLLSIPLSVFSSTLVILECELLEGGTMDDVKRINSDWVVSVNKMNQKKVSSQVLEDVLSYNSGKFVYIDTYEDPVHWGETRLKIKNGSIQEINDEFDSVSRCNSGMMYDAEDS
tara:strand:+ start:562 stop:975 length:414 start_codon:yes stop_codon:yes gene_type:complete